MKRENIHDQLFKQTLSIRSEAKALVQLFLPKWLTENLDFRSFKLSPNSFISEVLSEYFTDMVYQVQWKEKKEPLFVSFLMEHKSYPDPKIANQLLRYLAEAYEQQFKNDNKQKHLSIVIPVVIYHGDKGWKKRTFSDFFHLPDERLKQYLPRFDYELIDLTAISDEYLMNVGIGYFLRSTFLVFKHKNDKAFIEQNTEEIFIFVEQQLDSAIKTAFTKAMLLYIFKAFNFGKQEFQSFAKKLPKMTGIVSGSLYEQLIQEGMEKGIEKGVEQGKKEEGYKKDVIAIRNMTFKKFSLTTIVEILGVKKEYVQQIQKGLKKEKRIIDALSKKQTPEQIAKQLKVSAWLVEVIQKLQIKLF